MSLIGNPEPPNPLYRGAKVFFGGYDRLTFLILMESNIFWELLTSNIMLITLGEYQDPPTPYPLDPYRGAGGMNEGGYLMSLTPV